MDPFLTGAIAGGIAGGLVALLLAARPRLSCPACGAPVPRLRVPRSLRQALFGGARCTSCGCKVDRVGRRSEPPALL